LDPLKAETLTAKTDAHGVTSVNIWAASVEINFMVIFTHTHHRLNVSMLTKVGFI